MCINTWLKYLNSFHLKYLLKLSIAKSTLKKDLKKVNSNKFLFLCMNKINILIIYSYRINKRVSVI